MTIPASWSSSLASLKRGVFGAPVERGDSAGWNTGDFLRQRFREATEQDEQQSAEVFDGKRVVGGFERGETGEMAAEAITARPSSCWSSWMLIPIGRAEPHERR
jgi:hypothetical protein